MLVIFLAFIVVFALLSVAHSESNRRAYKLFMFGFLVSILYAAVYSFYSNAYPIMMMVFTSLALLTQYFHIRAVDAGRVKSTKLIVDVSKKHDLGKGKKMPHEYKFVV
jgi:hypothetical protein